jgi:hypothetical protein
MSEKDPDWISRMIMKREKVPYSHIAIEFEGDIYHAVGEGVCVDNYKEYMEAHTEQGRKVVQLKCIKATFLGYIEGSKGKDYSETQWIGFMFPWFRRWFDDNKSEVICSEFVARILARYTDIDFDYQNLDFLTPKQVFEMIPDRP